MLLMYKLSKPHLYSTAFKTTGVKAVSVLDSVVNDPKHYCSTRQNWINVNTSHFEHMTKRKCPLQNSRKF